MSKKRFYKVLDALETKNGYHYHTGFNDLTPIPVESAYRGINHMICYFTDVEHIFAYLNYGPIIRSVTMPKGTEPVYDPEMDAEITLPGWYSDKVILGRPHEITVSFIKKLIRQGARIDANDYEIFRWAIMRNPKVFWYVLSMIHGTSVEKYVISDLKYRGFI